MAIVGYWRLNGNSNDASGNANNGTDTNITYSQANGVLDGGAGFDGSTSKIIVSNGKIDNSQQGTFSVAFKMNSPSTITLFGYGDSKTSLGNGLLLQIRNISGSIYSPSIIQTVGASVILNGYYASVTLDVNKINFITYKSTGSLWKIYVNGVEYPLTALSFNNGTNNGNWFADCATPVGNSYSSLGTSYFEGAWGAALNGFIDEAKLYDTDLPYAKIKNEYSRLKGFF